MDDLRKQNLNNCVNHDHTNHRSQSIIGAYSQVGADTFTACWQVRVKIFLCQIELHLAFLHTDSQ